MNFNELGLTFWSLLSYFLFHQRTKESSVVDRKFAGMFDRPSSWVGAAHHCLIAITGSIAKRQCFTIELDTEHRGKSTLAPVPGNKKADGKTIGLSFFEVFLGGFGRARLLPSLLCRSSARASTQLVNAVKLYVAKLVKSFGRFVDAAESLDDFRYTKVWQPTKASPFDRR